MNHFIESLLYKKEGMGQMMLRDNGLGNLKQIADMLWDQMLKEVEKNGHSDLTLGMEGAARGIYEIINLNDIK
jgi:hypothetical protein